ncbi:MAG: UxaA family hydrolase [Chloroflexi bacterium]|nr:UxaA family hydrolase [Chloroflexota bacterium]
MSNDTFLGYRRPDGRVGVRNHVAVIPSCGCALHAAAQVAAHVGGSVLLGYDEGCGATQHDIDLGTTWLAQCGRHPNVVGTLVVSLGCETLDAADLAQRIGQGWAPVELLVIQQEGGTLRTIERGAEIVRRMVASAATYRAEPCPVSALSVGLECGGSDATSGMAANPAMGAFSDLLVEQGAQVILAETSELLGADHILTGHAATPEVACRLTEVLAECERFYKATGEDFMGKQPAPGNVVGGISTVEEKALGDALKGGSSPIVDVLAYGQPPSKPGLSFMDTPGNDPLSVTGLVAAGCQVVAFTTGRGNPMGNPIAPVIKITGNAATYARMGADMDLDASPIITGEATIAQVGQWLYDLCLAVASGRITAAEATGHDEFKLLRQGVVF